MFEQAFKNIDDFIWKDNGCDNPIDYAKQSSWILFLKWLDDYEADEETRAKLDIKNLLLFLKKVSNGLHGQLLNLQMER